MDGAPSATDQVRHRRHIVAVTMPMHGHAIRLIRLSMLLASKGFTVTFISTHSQLKAVAHEAASKNIHFAGVHDLDLIKAGFLESVDAMASRMPDIDQLLHTAEIQLNAPVCCILSDMILLPFLGPIRDKRPHCQLVAVGIGCASFNLLDQHLTNDGGINMSATISDLPTRLSLKDLPFSFQENEVPSQFQLSLSKHIHQANWFVINTFEELEGYALSALRHTYKLSVLGVGPLHLLKDTNKTQREEAEVEQNNTKKSSTILPWLLTKQPSSVIYISFGTVANLSVANMRELAVGLEASHVNFLWVIRSSSLLPVLPDGFIERTCERGLVVDWCPQVQVLKHPSIGAFLTHGGWNSILEAISNGIPMLGWPLIADQYLNCKLITEVWMFGIMVDSAIGELYGTPRTIEREKVEAVIRSIMEDARSNGVLKARALQLQAQAMRAVDENGSSSLDFLQLVNSLKRE